MSNPLSDIRRKYLSDPCAAFPGKSVTFLNFGSYRILRRTDLLHQIDGICIDGIAFVKLLRMTGIKYCSRVSFDMTSAAPTVFDHASRNGLSVVLIGSTADAIASACANILRVFPKMHIVKSRHGFFQNEGERQGTVDELAVLNPDIVVVGMGAPRQCQFLVDLRRRGWKGTGFTCGGFFHQTARSLYYYPPAVDRLQLRWLYRIYDEPRLVVRYLFHYPLFLPGFLYDLFEEKWITSSAKGIRC